MVKMICKIFKHIWEYTSIKNKIDNYRRCKRCKQTQTKLKYRDSEEYRWIDCD